MFKQIFLTSVCALLVFPQLSVGESVSMIAFVSDRTNQAGSLEVFVMNSDGAHQKQLTSIELSQGMSLHPAWSPDGHKLAYVYEGVWNDVWLASAETERGINRKALGFALLDSF